MKLRQVITAGVAVAASVTIVGVGVSCSSSAPGTRAPSGAENASVTGHWAHAPAPAPVGVTQDSLGAANWVDADGDGIADSRWFGVPQVDVNGGLAQSQVGAGGPHLPLLGDIPVAGTLFREGRVSSNGRALADPSCLPPLTDEIWVIERRVVKVAAANDEVPGCGALMTCMPDEPTKEVPVPLKHTDVKASIAGAIASVQVTQQFFNPFAGKIEAVYVFPLPENSAVNEFIMTVGDRRIRGIIREREEAQRVYEAARAQGYTASLLTQERPNIFTQKVANIEPGKGIDISIRYFNTLSYNDGEFEFVFPMVVGPRFNPPHRTDGVYARGEGMPRQGIWNDEATEVQYLAPDRRSGHDIGVEVAIDTGAAPIETVTCRSHAVDVERASSGDQGKAVVRLRKSDSVPNKDFVLRYKLAGDGIRTSVVACQGERGGYVSMMLVPPREAASVKRRALEMVFVLDCSGSMAGEPLSQAKHAIERALKQLEPTDTFQVIRFSSNATTLGPAPIAATQENVRRGIEYLGSLNSEGGTMMIEGVRAALDFPHDPSRLRFVCFLTDGFIGNEDEILTEVQNRLGPARIFSFGIGTSVNRYLMDSMARLGRGAVSYLAAGDSASDIMDSFMQRISHAPMTDIKVEFMGLGIDASSVYPSRIPDMFAGRPVMISGRFSYTGAGEAMALVSGNVGGERVAYSVPVRVNASAQAGGSAAALSSIWARHKIADLADAGAGSGIAEVAGSIKQTALEFGLMSPYTAFIAVDSSTRTDGTYGTSVAVPVPVPEGVRYDTTVTERGSPYK